MQLPPIVTDYFAAWNSQDAGAIVSCFHANGRYHDPYVPEGVSGDALAIYTQSVFKDLATLSFTIVRSYVCDEATIVEWLMRTTSGINIAGVDIFVVRLNKIDSIRGYFDRKTFEAQRRSGTP